MRHSEVRIQLQQRLDQGHYKSIEGLSCSYSSVDITALAQLLITDAFLAESMFPDLTAPHIIIPLCTFLAYISSPAVFALNDFVIEDLAFKPLSGDLSSIHLIAIRLGSILNVSHRIQLYLWSNAHGEEIDKFNLMVF